eukprot:165646-Chlamydomonas_euryale.AAC.1
MPDGTAFIPWDLHERVHAVWWTSQDPWTPQAACSMVLYAINDIVARSLKANASGKASATATVTVTVCACAREVEALECWGRGERRGDRRGWWWLCYVPAACI